MPDIEKLKAERSAAHAVVRDHRRHREEAERDLEDARARLRSARRDADADRLLPEGAGVAVASATDIGVEELEERIESLERREEELQAEAEAADRALADALETEIPKSLEEVADAFEAFRESLRALTSEPVDAAYPRAVEAWERLRSGGTELDGLIASFPSGGERSLGHAPRARVRRYLKELREGVTPQEATGYVLFRTLEWSRTQGSPAAAFWQERGLPPTSGAITERRWPVSEEEFLILGEDRLPVDLP